MQSKTITANQAGRMVGLAGKTIRDKIASKELVGWMQPINGVRNKWRYSTTEEAVLKWQASKAAAVTLDRSRKNLEGRKRNAERGPVADNPYVDVEAVEPRPVHREPFQLVRPKAAPKQSADVKRALEVCDEYRALFDYGDGEVSRMAAQALATVRKAIQRIGGV